MRKQWTSLAGLMRQCNETEPSCGRGIYLYIMDATKDGSRADRLKMSATSSDIAAEKKESLRA